MLFNKKMVDELNLILTFPDNSMMQGIKVHADAEPCVIEAAQRLFAKGIIDKADGGYLTDLGLDLAEHAQVLKLALSEK
ncbi:TIGR02647 family protein [Pseudoalteromonas tunicata]|jgi:uncharacterized protein (TIGR02647 family)|uniref:DNA-binding protein inhibitor Id-2-related protein n=1 Tax=Pseudoalteromonas tunicata D2 TaxID=87626 RepID=A4C4Y7_9GAMM|nr:TIGR02647 family protein [Pseudoalteromonas tunicata]ATC96908.1 hypothetical protein PTUN_b0536 [Pseudoalteromonas tunicata]AXT33041.1 TIGR02647 family protein [Pseudoalteromonas tunicata]EAR30619.1 hypothetical protein PTD2_03581 [Pseudoalteromonas tunicata D2]MDP4983423.1 TIGR02647 family protein [Pseudoalteromonas tunicata]MDP5212592.1 TIGR02647 family protein [Pseudoalteromonas tunicata]